MVLAQNPLGFWLATLPTSVPVFVPVFGFTLQFTPHNCIALCTLPINLTRHRPALPLFVGNIGTKKAALLAAFLFLCWALRPTFLL